MKFTVTPADAKDFLEKLDAKQFGEIILYANYRPPMRGITRSKMKTYFAEQTWKKYIECEQESRLVIERFTVAKPIPEDVLQMICKTKGQGHKYNAVAFRRENLTPLFIIAVAAKTADIPLKKFLIDVFELKEHEQAEDTPENTQQRYRMPYNFKTVDLLIASLDELDSLPEKSLENLKSDAWKSSVLQHASSEIISTAAPKRATTAKDKGTNAKRQKHDPPSPRRSQRTSRSTVEAHDQ